MLLEVIGIVGIGLYAAVMEYRNKPNNKKMGETDLKLEKTGIRFRKKPVVPFLGDRHSQLLEEFSPNNDEQNPVEKLNNRHLTIAFISLGFAIVGKLIYFPLILLSLPGIIYISQHALFTAYNTLIKQKKVSIDFVFVAGQILLIVNGYFVFACIPALLFAVNRKLLFKITDNSKKNLVNVFKQQPRSVWVIHNGLELEVSFGTLKPNDTVVVHAGEVIPIDGHITEGMASIDQHILTGEFQPVEKGVNDQVFALTVVLSGKIYIQVEKTGQETTASQIAQILNQTINSKTDIQFWAKEMSDKTALPTLLLSGLTFFALDSPTSPIVILVSHFKYRAVITTAIGVLNYLNLASRNGILIKDGRTFELLKKVDTIVFDKTGTLTEEQPRVWQIHSNGEYSENEILRYAATAESKQAHPIAKAILQKAREQQLNLPTIDDSSYKVGYGIIVKMNNKLIRVGSLRFLELEGVSIFSKTKQIQKLCYNQGHPVVFVGIDNRVVGAIELQAILRPEVKNVISQLRQQSHIKFMYIISGDHEAPTKKLAEEIGVNDYFAETLPENKADLIEQFQNEGKSVCYIGDGINDSIALKKADVSISLRGASTVATDAAQIILMDQSLNNLGYLFELAQRFETNMKTTWALVVIPSFIAMGGAIFWHFGLIHGFLGQQIGLGAGVISAMKPMLQNKRKKRHLKK
jgi:heavy metal translocating P-type ATPase